MIKPIVLVKHPQHGWLLIHRFLNQLVYLTELEVGTLNSKEIIHRSVSNGFVSASYEITELCNAACVHCYLNGVRRGSVLTTQQQLDVVRQIETSGVIWLQITGGEPLIAHSFPSIYTKAWDMGFLITVLTNGLLLGEQKFIRLFQKRPPFRLSISMYGANKETYKRVTQLNNGWDKFMCGVRSAKKAGLRLRIKVIELKENSHERDAMIELARRYGEYDHICDIMPTLDGNLAPLEHQIKNTAENDCWSGCTAGTESFHVTSDGEACLCKTCRVPSVSLTELAKLKDISKQILSAPEECLGCETRFHCRVCPPLYRLLTMQRQTCAKGGDANARKQ